MSHGSVSQSWVDNGDLDALILDSLEQGKSPAAHRMLGSNICNINNDKMVSIYAIQTSGANLTESE